MNLQLFLSERVRREGLAAALGASPGYLWQIATNWRGRKASPVLALAIERATGGQVTRYDLRPDIFGPAPDAAQKAA